VDPKTNKGVVVKIVILSFYDQAVKVRKGWVEVELVLLIIAGLPNEKIPYWILTFVFL
jgi:hypothetical protein